MGSNKITNVADPTGTQDAATTNYVDLLGSPKYIIISGTIQNSMGSDITLYTLPAGKTFDNGKIWVIKLWVERYTGEWLDAESGGFKSLGSRLHVFIRGPSIMTNFSEVPVSG